MTWTEERIAINQHLQIGAEATTALGTSVSAGKELLCFDIVYQPKGDTAFYRGTGRKYPSEQEQNTEWMDSTWSGNLDYNGLIYPLASALGNVAAAGHLSSSTAKDWIFTPTVTGSIVPRTYTIEQGDATYAQKSTYNLLTDWGYTVTRKATSFTGKGISQAIQTGITLSSTPAAVALAPIPGKHFNVYMDTTSGGLGGTKLTKVLQVQFSMGPIYNPFWPINSANASFANHLDMPPATTIKLLMEADSTGLARVADWEAGTTYFVQVDALGTVAIASDGPGSVYNEFKHNMAVKFGEPSQFQDKDGVYAIEWTGTVVEDATWGNSQVVTCTNLITAL